MPPASRHILTVNGGSSSIKFALFEVRDSPAELASARLNAMNVHGTMAEFSTSIRTSRLVF
jgi:acetate kinase